MADTPTIHQHDFEFQTKDFVKRIIVGQ
jgi:hypothetical protein